MVVHWGATPSGTQEELRRVDGVQVCSKQLSNRKHRGKVQSSIVINLKTATIAQWFRTATATLSTLSTTNSRTYVTLAATFFVWSLSHTSFATLSRSNMYNSPLFCVRVSSLHLRPSPVHCRCCCCCQLSTQCSIRLETEKPSVYR